MERRCLECGRTFGVVFRKNGVIMCPYCGGTYEVLDRCEKCGEMKPAQEHLCTNCHTKLIAKFRNFRDHLTAEEEADLNEMIEEKGVENV